MHRDTKNKILESVYNRLISINKRIDTEENRELMRKELCFSFYPTSWHIVSELLGYMERRKVDGFTTFCDIGCGMNNIGYLASLIGYQSVGVELSPLYRKLAYNSDDIIEGNILDKHTMGRTRFLIDSIFRKGRTIFYSWSPITQGTRPSNISLFFNNIESILKKGDVFIYNGTSEEQYNTAYHLFDVCAPMNTGPKIYKKRPPVRDHHPKKKQRCVVE